MPTCDTVCDNALSNTGCDGSFDNGSDRIHGSDNLGLKLWRDVELDLLEEVLGGTKTTNDKDILQ